MLDFVGAPPVGAWGPVGTGTPAPDRTPLPPATAPIVWLRHARAELALHCLKEGGEGSASDEPHSAETASTASARSRAQTQGTPLLLLHGLAERSPEAVPPYLAEWPGPVFALDFVGHGASTMPEGGGYTAEMLLADADTALRHLGEATVLGRGLGAYVALLLAGARPDAVRGAILFDGPGILGGGTGPGPSVVAAVDGGRGRSARSVRVGRAVTRPPTAGLRDELRSTGDPSVGPRTSDYGRVRQSSRLGRGRRAGARRALDVTGRRTCAVREGLTFGRSAHVEGIQGVHHARQRRRPRCRRDHRRGVQDLDRLARRQHLHPAHGACRRHGLPQSDDHAEARDESRRAGRLELWPVHHRL